MILKCYLCQRSISDSPGRSVGAAIMEADTIVLAQICHTCDEAAR